ncbi:MAG TPA: hypothetical protein VGD37_00200 [Kofleriaceae bacterium]
MEACELLALELRLDRIEAELARELPPHLRSFARAHAHGVAPPPAPEALQRATTLATARAALAHPVLADRGLALLRLAAPLAIESDPEVTAARAAEPTWDALAVLAAARDAAAAARFGRRAVDVMHQLHGSVVDLAAGLAGRDRPPAAGGADPDVLPPAVAGWFEPDRVVVDDLAIERAWQALGARHGIDGAVRFERAPGARPRTFVIEPRREVVIAIPARVATPAERFAVLHELGHAAVALALPGGIPRIVDEAAAAYAARAIEHAGHPWYSPPAAAARARRLALARMLDRIERELPALPAAAARPAERPPRALWHDPGAQAAYVAAEALADAIEQTIGSSPAPGALATAVDAACHAIARATQTL